MKFIGCDVPNRKHTIHKMGSSISFLFMFGIIQITCGVQASRKTLVGATLTCAAIVTKLQNSIIQRHRLLATMSNKWKQEVKKTPPISLLSHPPVFFKIICYFTCSSMYEESRMLN